MIDAAVVTGAAAGTATGMALQGAHGKLKQMVGGETDERDEHRAHFHHISETLACIAHSLKEIEKNTASERDKPVQLVLVLMPGNFIPFNPFGKFYTTVFSKTASVIVVDVPGVGQTNLTLVIGWNRINLPQGTQIGLSSSATSNVNLLFRATNTVYGNEIV